MPVKVKDPRSPHLNKTVGRCALHPNGHCYPFGNGRYTYTFLVVTTVSLLKAETETSVLDPGVV
jgi:hypothetical protein